MKEKDVTLNFKLPPPEESPEVEGANVFFFTFAGADIQMLVGYVDLRSIHLASQGGSGDIPVQVSHRFMLSQVGFEHLRSQIQQITDKMRDTGPIEVPNA
ncbi:MAG: hypothetical protein HOP28_16350 [Gemmatimonadales bacterium]|nr:hypothetical protein [Gemmatimonadales bacterium]